MTPSCQVRCCTERDRACCDGCSGRLCAQAASWAAHRAPATKRPPNTHAPAADASALREAFNDASYFKDEGVRAFKLGVLSLEERAQVCGH